ncbi:MAG: hypothetical protein Q7U92_01605 [Bradyrhizobium sp.]|nr:hypothetical protein [Bradyrhizobium sp.]MDO9563734.1 hypothetical protein [Bradyrhizobium sp.]
MRTSGRILLGSFAALAVLSAPVLAQPSGAQKSDDKRATPVCSAYEKAPDGSWTPAPCREIGPEGQSHRRSAPRGDDADD